MHTTDQVRQSSPRLRIAQAAPRARRAAPTGVVAQVRCALQPHNRLATALGALLGGGVPVASYQLAHHEVDPSQPLWAQLSAWLVLGGLLFSAITVCSWGKLAFGSRYKAVGFTVLLEGVLTCAHTPWLAAAGLCYLVCINAVATGVRLSQGA
jgi:hypothetical protein